MALRARTLSIQLGATNTTPANNILAASALTRYVRSIIPINNDTVARDWSLAYAAAIITAVNGEPFTESIPARSRGTPIYYGGKGRRFDNVALAAFASVTGMVTLEIQYDESDATDA